MDFYNDTFCGDKVTRASLGAVFCWKTAPILTVYLVVVNELVISLNVFQLWSTDSKSVLETDLSQIWFWNGSSVTPESRSMNYTIILRSQNLTEYKYVSNKKNTLNFFHPRFFQITLEIHYTDDCIYGSCSISGRSFQLTYRQGEYVSLHRSLQRPARL